MYNSTVDLSLVPQKYQIPLEKFINHLFQKSNLKIISVVIYGSVARGSATEVSDLDLLIITKELPSSWGLRKELFSSLSFDIAVNHGIRISPFLLTLQEAEKTQPIYLDMTREAIILYDENDFVRKILHQLQVKLNALGAQRFLYKNKYIWKLKENFHIGEVIEF